MSSSGSSKRIKIVLYFSLSFGDEMDKAFVFLGKRD